MKWYQKQWVQVMAVVIGLILLVLSIPIIGNLWFDYCVTVDRWFK